MAPPSFSPRTSWKWWSASAIVWPSLTKARSFAKEPCRSCARLRKRWKTYLFGLSAPAGYLKGSTGCDLGHFGRATPQHAHLPPRLAPPRCGLFRPDFVHLVRYLDLRGISRRGFLGFARPREPDSPWLS